MHALTGLFFRHAPHFQGKSDIVKDVFAAEQIEILKDHAHVAAQQLKARRVQSAHLAAHDLDAARIVGFQAVEAAQNSGLARARMPHNAEDVALGNVKADAVQNLVGPKAFGHVPDLDHSPDFR